MTRTVTIRETPNGWLDKTHDKIYPSAAAARVDIQREDSRNATNAHANIVTMIVWEPTTAVGRAVLRALA